MQYYFYFMAIRSIDRTTRVIERAALGMPGNASTEVWTGGQARLDVEDDARPVAIFLGLYACFVPGHSLNRAAQFVTARIIWLAPGGRSQLSAGEVADLKATEEQILRVEQEDQFVQPGNQQRHQIVSLGADLAADTLLDLLRRNQQALHAGGCVAEKLWQRLAIGVQTDIGGVIERLVWLARHHASPPTGTEVRERYNLFEERWG